MKYLYVSITFFLSVSCAIHTGNTTGNAELQGSDFEIIDIGYGEAHTFKIFGIGGLSTNTLVYDAKKDLYRRYPLKKGQAYANVSIDFRRLFVIPYFRTNCTVTADIVQYGRADSADIQSVFNRFLPVELPLTQLDILGTIQFGDTVVVFESGIARKGELKQYYEDESEGRYCLVSFGASETRAVSESQVFGIQEVVITTSGDTLRVEDECTTTR